MCHILSCVPLPTRRPFLILGEKMPTEYRGFQLNDPGDREWGDVEAQLFRDIIDAIQLNTEHRQAMVDPVRAKTVTAQTFSPKKPKKDAIKKRLDAIK